MEQIETNILKENFVQNESVMTTSITSTTSIINF